MGKPSESYLCGNDNVIRYLDKEKGEGFIENDIVLSPVCHQG